MVENIIPNFQEDLNLDVKFFYDKHSDVFDHDTEVRVYKVLYRLVENDKSYKVKYGHFYHPNDGKFVYPGGQIDFIVYKEKKGFALIEVKGIYNHNYFQTRYDEAQKQLMRANDTLRDQIVLPYILWKNNINIKDCGLLGNYCTDKHYFVNNFKTNVNGR